LTVHGNVEYVLIMLYMYNCSASCFRYCFEPVWPHLPSSTRAPDATSLLVLVTTSRSTATRADVSSRSRLVSNHSLKSHRLGLGDHHPILHQTRAQAGRRLHSAHRTERVLDRVHW